MTVVLFNKIYALGLFDIEAFKISPKRQTPQHNRYSLLGQTGERTSE